MTNKLGQTTNAIVGHNKINLSVALSDGDSILLEFKGKVAKEIENILGVSAGMHKSKDVLLETKPTKIVLEIVK
ncbi:hypothetical protein KY343_04865 [Candidatus Woesearchaeota archaeon]|nr:hypothetical protein [Candidatus Woesearchaeota archaeon]